MKISKEMEEFVKSESEWKSNKVYASLSDITERIMPISPGKNLEKKYKEAIDFCHLDASPRGVFSFSILLAILTFFIPLSLLLLFNIFSPLLIILVICATFGVFFYFYNYPFNLATSFRIKASSEMVLAIIYMTMAMRVKPNLEHAVKYAAMNLKGPLSSDLKRLLWDVYVGKFVSMSDALDSFCEKWKRENEEFTTSISLIKTAFNESSDKMDRMFSEAVANVLEGTKERMKGYARSLRAPLTVVNALGFLLPIIGLIFLPLLAIFMQDIFQPTFLIIGYCIILPGTVYWLMHTFLQKRPYTFHQPDVSKHPKFRAEKQIGLILISILIPLLFIGMSYYFISTSEDKISLSSLLFSLLITLSIAGGIATYCIFSTIKKLKIRDEIVQVERELGEVLFLLGHQIGRGIPIENALKEVSPKIKDMKIAGMFDIILNNIKSFGMNFDRAVFDKEHGAINYYPSNLISAVMKVVVEISKSGMGSLSKGMISISTYLKDMNSVEENLHEILDETSSSMELQAMMLAPIASGIVVSLTSIVIKMLGKFSDLITKSVAGLEEGGVFGAVGSTTFESMINIHNMMPPSVFQLIVGVYMMEVVGMLAIFLTTIKYGEDSTLKKYNLGKKLIIATLIYAVVLIFIYLLFNTAIDVFNVEEFG